MAGKQKAVFIRFNMADEADRGLYLKLAEAAGSSVSLTSYVKRALEEHFSVKIEITGRQEFHEQMLLAVREEMQAQGMNAIYLVGVLHHLELNERFDRIKLWFRCHDGMGIFYCPSRRLRGQSGGKYWKKI